MHGLHENQKKILDHLLESKNGATLEELAKYLGISKTGAKEHLIRIERMGLISYIDARGAIGRPKRRYVLSAEGHDVFPKQYSWLSNLLLELLAEDLGRDAIARLMSELADKTAKSMEARFKSAANSAELLAIIAQTLNELGYRSSLRQSDLRKGAIIEASNCVYHSVAKKHPELCGFDIRFIENATGGMNVKLETCIARGGSVCRFCIKKK